MQAEFTLIQAWRGNRVYLVPFSMNCCLAARWSVCRVPFDLSIRTETKHKIPIFKQRHREQNRVKTVRSMCTIVCVFLWFVVDCAHVFFLCYSFEFTYFRSTTSNYYLLWSERQGDGARLDGLLPPNKFCDDVEWTCNVSIVLVLHSIQNPCIEVFTPFGWLSRYVQSSSAKPAPEICNETK